MHPSESILSAKSTSLQGKRIVLGITGSIAAVESFEIARELVRHGAEVTAVMSSEATKLITPRTMEFATGREVITDIDGRAQHVSMFGDFPDKADLLLIAPCTANTISKMALGIDDTPVTTMATVAIGTKTPLIVAPAMHLAMYEHPVVQKNVATLRDLGVQLVGPHTDGKKARIASNEEIVGAVIRKLGRNDFRGRKVLVIGGSSEEAIDQMRIITNRGTGETAVTLAKEAYFRGAEVELWAGRMQVSVPSYIPTKRFRTVSDLLSLIKDIDQDIVLMPAALSDFGPQEKEGKVSSDAKELILKLRPLCKVLPEISRKGSFLVGFKAEHGVSQRELIKRATRRLRDYGLDMIVANDLRDVGKGETKVVIIDRNEKVTKSAGSKTKVAETIFDAISKGA